MRQFRPQELADQLNSTILKETLIRDNERIILWWATDKEVELIEYEDAKLFVVQNPDSTAGSSYISINHKLIKDTTKDEFHKWSPRKVKESKDETVKSTKRRTSSS